MEKKNNSLVIILMVVIIVILAVLCVLFATDTITFNTNANNNNENQSTNQDDQNTNQENQNNNQEQQDEITTNKYTREEVVEKLKEKLKNISWVEEYLYSKKNTFNDTLDATVKQDLTFAVTNDSSNNPVVVVLNKAEDSFLIRTIRVYFDGNDVIAESILGIYHPEHVNYYIDINQGLVFWTYEGMGYYEFKALDIKGDKISEYDVYECKTDNCGSKYISKKKYDLANIKYELNDENIDKYIK